MALIISDPTLLLTGGLDTATTFAAPITINTSTKTITITPGSGTLPAAADGVTGQALYSALKLLWKNSSTYIKFPFPMEAITPEQFEFINGWVLADDTTRKALRTCGWAERGSAGTSIIRKYMGIVSLGTLGSTDQPYYQWNTGSKVDFDFPGVINEGIQIFGDSSNGNFDYSDGGDTLKLFCREQGKLYASSNNTAIGATTLNYITYRFPLSNSDDLNIAAYATDAAIASAPTVSTATWSGGVLTINTSAAHNFTAGVRVRISGASNTAYNGVYTVATAPTGTQFTVAKASDPGAWGTGSLASIYASITVEYFSVDQPYDVSGDAVNENYRYIITDSSTLATTAEIYQKIQYQLRQNIDIDTGAGSVIGATADSLLTFVGSTLVGSRGVYISGLNSNFLNSVQFYDFTTNTLREYPFIASGVINFGANAGTGDFKYWMFYSDLTGTADYGSTDAVLVKDKDGNDITGTYTGSAVSWNFKYDSETAGGLRTAGQNAPVVVVGIGLTGGQWASVNHTITKTAGQSILLAPAQERNYSNT
jgi:hypothetical protein